jgi:phosphosulfolactate phosphohydrolase-like enzyme
MPAKTPTATTSGIPTAKHHFPPGTPAAVCIDHNRACKVARIVTAALAAGYDADLTDTEIDLMADAAGVRRPGGDDTREAVRAGLYPPFTDYDSSNQDITEAVLDAAGRGRPFRFTTHDGRNVLLVAFPVGE